MLYIFTQPAVAKQNFYDPDKGFKPAQPELIDIMLQLAGSLEHYGSPEPYIRHVMAEHKRIDALYAKATGDAKSSSRPSYLTDEKVDLLIKNWRSIEKPLQLELLCKECGVYMRHGIRGSWNKTHTELLAEETKLTKQEKAIYLKFLKKPFFKKADQKELEKFYADGNGWDKLSSTGRDQIGMRTELSMKKPKEREAFQKNIHGDLALARLIKNYQKQFISGSDKKVNSSLLKSMLVKDLELDKSNVDYRKFNWKDKDAIRYSHYIKEVFQRRFALVDKKLNAADAEIVKKRMTAMVDNLRIIANSEMCAGFREEWLKEQKKK